MPPRSEWWQAWDGALDAGRALEALRASHIVTDFPHLHIVVHLTKPTRLLLS